MTTKKVPEKQEPLLNTVARKLGHAAGALTNVAQGLTENLSAIPEAISTRMRPATGAGTRGAGLGRATKKKAIRASARRKPKAAAGSKNQRRAGARRSPRSSRQSSNQRTKNRRTK